MRKLTTIFVVFALIISCKTKTNQDTMEKEKSAIEVKADEFATFKLTTNLDHLSNNQHKMLSLLYDAADIMNDIFWMEAFGDKNKVLVDSLSDAVRKFVKINYGPWERLDNNQPFLEGYGKKTAGASFYPADMSKDEFKAWDNDTKTSLYTIIKRDSEGNLQSVPYHVAFKTKIKEASKLLKGAADLAEDKGFKTYLRKRAKALLTDDYYESDIAWLDMKNNKVDFVVGPIENYEDQLFGYKASHEAFILIKDTEWSKKLERFTTLLPQLQKDLPTDEKYKNETPGSDTQINAYDVIYYAGDCNAGSKTIAINLPNDEKVRANKGSRKLQLKNAMRAKFDKIMQPIADLLIVEEQRKNVTFDAFFENTMYHEVSHGLGLGKTADKKTTVRQALKETYTSIEEGKADILGLWCIYQLNEQGEFQDKELMDNFVTFLAGIFRSVRFGASSAHGKANMIRFNYFKEKGAFERNEVTGLYRVDFEKMKQAMFDLSDLILTIQGNGDYEAAVKLIEEKGKIGENLGKDLHKISKAGIPRDVVFEQGKDAVGL